MKKIISAGRNILIALIFTGCAVPKVADLPEARTVPDRFEANSDTGSIAEKSYARFFTDTLLVSLIDTALKLNPDLAIALERVEIARAQVRMARGFMRPNLSGSIAAGVDKFGDYTIDGVGNFDTNLSPNIDKDQNIPIHPTPDLFVGLRSNWEIDLWKKLRNRREAAMFRVLATERGKNFVISNLVAELASGYYDLLALDNELNILRKNIELHEKALEVSRNQKEGGRATELAVQQFAAQLYNTKSAESIMLQQVAATENRVNALMGRFPQPIERSSVFLEQAVDSAVSSGLSTSMIARRPDVQEAEMELAATRADVRAARAAFLPSLNLSAYIGLNAFKPELLFNPASVATGILAGLSAPILNRNQIEADFSIANAQSRQAFYNYERVILNSFAEVRTNIQTLHYYNRAFSLKQQEANSLLKAVNTATDLYMTGYANYLEVITAQRGVLQAELNLAENKRYQFEALIKLYVSLGGGWQ